jgi:hypothetical protein
MRDVARVTDQVNHARILSDLVTASLRNINRTFFLVIEHENKAWFVWADSRADAIECVEIMARWFSTTPAPILSGNEQGEVG